MGIAPEILVFSSKLQVSASISNHPCILPAHPNRGKINFKRGVLFLVTVVMHLEAASNPTVFAPDLR